MKDYSFLDEKHLLEEEINWKKEKKLIKRKLKIEKEKQKLEKSRHKVSTTKILISFLFISCTIIELFTGWVTIQTFSLALKTGLAPDFTPLVTLIGAVVGEVFSFAIYAVKAAKENTEGGLQYELTMQEYNNNNSELGG